jgi:AcrR family transcriptional regulator
MSEPAVTGGRGARARILTAAMALFYEQGINATGMKQLTGAAHVSTRTFYQHFDSKDDLIVEYLRRWDAEHLLAGEASLDDVDAPPRARLLGLFDRPPEGSAARGCPLHNAAVEISDPESPARAVVTAHKLQFLHKIEAALREANAPDPATLAYQLAVLYEGARSWWTSTGDLAAFHSARKTAEVLLA